LKRRLLEGVRIPEEAIRFASSRARFTSEKAQAALEGSGVSCPPLHSYAWKVWDYWERHMDPEVPTERNLRQALQDRVVVVTGASSGIGRRDGPAPRAAWGPRPCSSRAAGTSSTR